MAEYLTSIGKSVRIINYSPLPAQYEFFRPLANFEQYNPAVHDEAISSADAVMIIDTNEFDRLRAMGDRVKRLAKKVIILDHHETPPTHGDVMALIDKESAASGELVYDFIASAMPDFGGSISKPGATGMYTAIMTDTGSFRFPRSDAELHEKVAALLRRGADPVAIYEETYNQSKPSRIHLLGGALSSITLHEQGALGIMTITQAMIKAAGASEEEVDGFIQQVMSLAGVTLGVLILELPEGVKLSFRSKGNVSASELAREFNGNGHKNAAGARVKTISVDEARKQILERAKKILK